MTPQSWLDLVEILAVIALLVWLVLVLRFGYLTSSLGRLTTRLRTGQQRLRALGLLLSFYRDSPMRQRCTREVEQLQAGFDDATRREARARWLVWLRPARAHRLLAEAWRDAIRCETRLLALFQKIEQKVLLRRELASEALAPVAPGAPDPLALQLEAVASLAVDLADGWSARSGELRRLQGLAPIEPSALAWLARARAAADRPQAWSLLADTAWVCAATSDERPRQPHQLRMLQGKAIDAFTAAQRQHTDAHAAIRWETDNDFLARKASLAEGDRLFTQGKALLSLLAWSRALDTLEDSSAYHRHSLGRGGLPQRRLPRPAPPPSHARSAPALEQDADADADDPELDLELPDDLLPGFEPDASALPDSFSPASEGTSLGGDGSWSGLPSD